MKVLHISNKPIYPIVDGGCVAMSKMLTNLSMIAENTHHIFINTPKHPFKSGAYPAEITLPLAPEHTFIDTSIQLFPALFALISGVNYNLKRFHTAAIEKQLNHYIQEASFDLIVLESLFLASYISTIRKVSNARIIVRAHNVEHELWEQQAVETNNFLKKWYLGSLAKSLKKAEIRLLNSADQIWTITNEDALKLSELGVEKSIHTIPVAMDIPTESVDYSQADFFHLGSLNWSPNQLAVQTLITNYWPKLRGQTTSHLHIAGSFSESITIQEQKGIIVHGFVEDVALFMRSHGILASPVRTGSGVRIKLLEALALGVPCITTSIGAVGIDPGANVLIIANSEEEWIQALLQLSQSQSTRMYLGENARLYMAKYHSFTAVNAQINHALGR